jgi:ankyrin repeat protein
MGEDMEELFAAIKQKDQPAVERILAADPGAATASDAGGVSALLTAVYHGNAEAAAALRATGMELTVFEAAAVGDLARVRVLIDADPTLARAYASDGFHPLGLAAFFGHTEVLRFLIAAGAEVSAPSRNRMRVTALHSALAGPDREGALALIAAGADVNARQQDGFTALHEAAQNGDQEMVETLLAAGADPSPVTGGGANAADVARTHGHPEIARRLEQAPARSE